VIAAVLAAAWVPGVVLAALDGRRRAIGWGAVAALCSQLVVVAVLAAGVFGGTVEDVVAGGWPAGVGIRLRADALGVVFVLVSVAVLLAALATEVSDGVQTRTFPALVLLMATGLTGLFLTADVFSFYVFFELSMLCAYGLTSIGDSPRQVGAGLVLAVVNLLGSFLFLLGIAALYHVTGTLEYGAVAERLAGVEPVSAALIGCVFFVAFAVKLGLFPFHFWLPAVYASSRPAVAAILSGALANIAAYALLRFGGELLPGQLELAATALVVLGVLSIVYGAMQAVARRDAAEVLAYSAVGQAGYIIVAIALGGPVGFAAATAFAVANSLTKALLFLGVGHRGPLMAIAFAVGALSVAGVPPTAGFIGKLAVFRSGIEDGAAGLVALLVLGSALSFLYMFQSYQHDVWRGRGRDAESSAGHRGAVTLLLAGVLVLGLWPEPLLAAGDAAAGALEARGR
jgi:multicomponent Na+:H+ antiporter subunit D